MRFRKKPVVVEARQWTGCLDDVAHVPAGILKFDTHGALFIKTLEGAMVVNVDDWIIRGVKGEFYPCKPDIFEATYEPVTS